MIVGVKQKAIAQLRLHSQLISQKSFISPAEVVTRFAAMQGQDYNGVKWSIGLRMASGATDATIEQALREMKIIRTWMMRGTLHIVAAADLHWMLPLFRDRVFAQCRRRYAELELDERTLNRCSNILNTGLQTNESLNRTELLALIEQKGISTKGQRAPFILQRASYEGLICQTVTIKNNPVYVSTGRLGKNTRSFLREGALQELALRYFTSRGPTTIHDFAYWSGLTISEARVGLNAVRQHLTSEKAGDQDYWFAPDRSLNSERTIYLLPGFDEFLLGYKERSASLAEEHMGRWAPGKNGMFMPFIVQDGSVVGLWKRTIKKNGVAIDLFDSKRKISKSNLAAAIDGYSQFVAR